MVKVPPERVKVPPMVMLPSAVKLPEDIVRLSLLYELLEAVRLPPVNVESAADGELMDGGRAGGVGHRVARGDEDVVAAAWDRGQAPVGGGCPRAAAAAGPAVGDWRRCR